MPDFKRGKLIRMFVATCDDCQTEKRLYAQRIKDAESDLRVVGWGKVEGLWHCAGCLFRARKLAREFRNI